MFLFTLFKKIKTEIFIISIFITIIFTIFSFPKRTIVADGIGYFDYLISIFYYHDFIRYPHVINEDNKLYDRVSKLENFCYNKYNEKYLVNKYPIGTALLMTPFFLSVYLIFPNNSFHSDIPQIYHITIFISTIFYLLLTLIFFRKLLLTYHLSPLSISLTQLFIVLSTNVSFYASEHASYSHIYSFFAITLFLYLVRMYYLTKQRKYAIFFSATFGLIFIIRNIDILILFFIPFLFDNPKHLKETINHFFKQKFTFFLSAFSFFIVFSILSISWYFQTGSFFVYSYGNESFNFLKPHFIPMLFSFNRGLFLIHPIYFIAFLSVLYYIIKRNYFHFFSWMIFFIFLTYILSSWHSWTYGASFGQRPFINYIPLFFIPFANLLNDLLKYKKKFSYVFLSCCSIFLSLNIIQTYQYSKYIIDWNFMNKEKYFKIFLKTHKKYRGWFWKMDFSNDTSFKLIKSIEFNEPINIPKSSSKKIDIIINTNNGFKDTTFNYVKVNLNSSYSENNHAKMHFKIVDLNSGAIEFEHTIYFLHFYGYQSRFTDLGFYYFYLHKFVSSNNKKIEINFKTSNLPLQIQNLHLDFIKKATL
jgi:hypothetical protein